ncbi:Ltp family lipoprotein [Rhodococcus triatomae]
MTEPYPTLQPGHQPVATAPKKRKKWPWVVGAIVLILGVAGAFGETDTEKTGAATAASPSSQTTTVASSTESKPDATAPVASAVPAEPVANSAPAAVIVPPVTTLAPAPAPAKPQISSSQRNAVRSAQDYLDYAAFSRSGLIDQLEFEGFSTEDATYAVDSVNADWNEQAARSAEQYLDYTSFSKSGLIDQLVFEGYTYAQAEYGADAAY